VLAIVLLCGIRCVREFGMHLVCVCFEVAGVRALHCGWCCGAFDWSILLWLFSDVSFFVRVWLPQCACFDRHGKYHRCFRAVPGPFWTRFSVGKSGGQR